jgi:hypothetical protein
VGVVAHPNEEALRKADAAQVAGDIPGMLELFSDDVVFHVGGRSNMAGDGKGKDQLVESYGRFIQALGEIVEMKTHDLLANDTHGVQLQSTTAQRDGKRITINGIALFHFDNGKVTEAWFNDEDPYAADAWYDAGA